MTTPIDFEKNAPSGERSPVPSIPTVNDGSLVSAVSKMKEVIELREGRRGSKYEQVVTWRDLYNVGLISVPSGSGGRFVVEQNGAVQGNVLGARGMMSKIEESIRNSASYKRFMARVGSEADLAIYPDEVRALLSKDILEEARKRGAAIQEVKTIIQDSSRSFAMKVQEITAALGSAQSSIQNVSFTSAEQNRAQAGVITTVKARLDDFGGDGVTIEEKMIATVDRLDGMSGVYSVRIGVDGKWAGLQLAVDAPIGAPAYSSFLIEADKFAIFTSGGDVSPFGADASGVYMNGLVRINAGGTTLSDIAARTTLTFIGDFASAPAGVKDNVYKNTTDGNSYVHNGTTWVLYLTKGTNGTNGYNGSDGVRGSLTLYASGSSWSDSTANSAITTVTGSATKVIGDTVTISNGTSFAGTKYWSGVSWVSPGVVIDGNLLVSGTVSASKLTVGQITVPSSSASIFIGGDSSAGFPFNLSALHVDSSGSYPGISIVSYSASSAFYVDSFAGSGVSALARASSGSGVSASASGTGGRGITATSTGSSGIGVVGEATQSSGFAAYLVNSGSGKSVTIGTSSYATYSGGGQGKHYAVDGLGPFTGFHDSLLPKEIAFEVGDIITDARLAYRHDISNTLFEVDVSSSPCQKTVIGIANDAREVDNFLELPYDVWWNYVHTHSLLAVNAVGEGQINVCGENGDIEAGDYIVTSSMRGKGMKQSDDIHRTYTVAKSRESVTFSSPDEVKMIACIYLCG